MKNYYDIYKNTLLNEVIPYWMRNAIDESGAINNCLSEDGTVLSKERYIWSQGRALWTFSAMYNRVERKQEYLDIATGLFNYLLHIPRNEDNSWNYLYDEDDNLIEGSISIYVDGFVLAGMTEYYIATNDERAKKTAIEIYEETIRRIKTPGSYSVDPYLIPAGMKTHGVNMVFSFFYTNLARAIGREDIRKEGYKLAVEVLESFYVKEKNAVLEFVNLDGSFSDTPEGRTCVPGHVIECMWFLINIFEETGETDKIEKCCKLIRRHIELAMDEKSGGLRLAIDIDGKEPVFWNKPTYKPWWVQVETLVATAYAYKHTRDEWFMDIHKKVKDYAFSNYPNGYGDWYNWLDCDGNPGETAALPVKDPFHLPRGLIYLMDIFKELDAECEKYEEGVLNYA